MANCTKHEDRETFLGCSSCERPFCFACLVQGPVGAKCRDCTRGISITATPRERATASATGVAKDKLLGLKIIVGAFLATNVFLYLQSTQNNNAVASVVSAFARSTRFAVQPYFIRHGEWWRLFTGAVSCGSLPTIALTAATVFWVGRLVARRLTHLEFLALSLASLAGGVLLIVLVKPDSFSYSGLSLAGGIVATYLVGRKRGALGVLTLPGAMQGWMGYGIFFLGWTVLGALGSETGGPYAFAGGALVAAPLAWRMFDPFPTSERSKGPAAVSVLVGALLFGGAAGASGAPTRAPAQPLSTADLMSAMTSAAQEAAPASPGWMKVSYWEDTTDDGDYQTYEVRCDPTPSIQNDRYNMANPVSACAWFDANPSFVRAHEVVDSPDCANALVWRVQIEGTHTSNSKPVLVNAEFEGSEDCGQPGNSALLEHLLSGS
jgi:membrane associated rhomboid family serine protease